MSDEKAIREVVTRWMRASKGGDTAAVLDLMTDDVVFLTPGREPFGKEVFRVAAAANAGTGATIDGEHEVVELEVFGERAWMRSKLSVRAKMPDGKVIVREGFCLTVLRKEAGAWKIARDANLLALKT